MINKKTSNLISNKLAREALKRVQDKLSSRDRLARIEKKLDLLLERIGEAK